MSAMEIGQRLVEFCRKGQNLEAINQMYADDVVSIEATDPPDGSGREMQGIEAVRGKNQWWIENHEIHDSSVSGPFPNGDDRFCLLFNFDVTSKPMNSRMKMEEVGLYTIRDGKIAKEEFFYSM